MRAVVVVSLLLRLSLVQGNLLPRIEEKDLFQAIKSRTLDKIHSLMDEGGKLSAFVIGSSDKYGQAVEAFRTEAPKCIQSLDHLPQMELSDGSVRTTFASVNGSQYPGCLNSTTQILGQHFSYLEDLVTQVAQIVVNRDLVYQVPGQLQAIELSDAPYKDHIHVYESSNNSQSNPKGEEYMVPYHVDNGLFLLITPFPGHGLQLQLSDGSVLKTDELRSQDVLVLFGLAMTQWMLQGDKKADLFYPTPHAVPSMAFAGVKVRSVFARMKVAPPMATPETDHAHHLATFEEIFMQKKPTENEDSQICSASLDSNGTMKSRDPWLKAMDTLCDNGDAFCWMGCYPLPKECPDPALATCFSEVTNVTCSTEKGGKPMDPTCKWACLPESAKAIQPKDFCNGRMGMLMFGFDFSGNKNNPCIVLFFEAWTLDTPLKFVLALIGVAGMGFCIEALMAMRRKILKRGPPFHRLRPLSRKSLIITIFGLKLVLGYLAMLVAMTYSFELFLFVIIGFVIGHAIFNINSDLGQSIDPCCSSSCDGKPLGTPLMTHSGSGHEETNCLMSPSNSAQPILDQKV